MWTPKDVFLGANVSEYQPEDGRISWCITARDYVNNAVKNVEEELLTSESHQG